MNLDEAISRAFQSTVESAGFIEIRPRKRVRDTKAPIREIITVQPLKGATYSIVWGFSIDFVPLFRNGRFTWHRTNKSCEFDLCIDPINVYERVPAWCSFYHLPGVEETTEKEILKIFEKTVPVAFTDFDSVSNLKDLAELFERREKLEYKRFGYDNYIQVYLAWGMVLHAIGKHEEAVQKIKAFCNRHDADENDPFLINAIKNINTV